MDFLYDFILNNQLLLLVIAVLLAMALIGYIAEEYGFYKKKENNEILETTDEVEIEQPIKEEKVEISNVVDNYVNNEQPIEEPEIIAVDEKVEEEPKVKVEQENLNIDKDFSKLLDDDDDIVVGDTSETKLNDIDDDLWKF